LINRYWPVPSTVAGSVVTVHVVPVEAAYWIDHPARLCGAPAL
jgi:hypothetical protein